MTVPLRSTPLCSTGRALLSAAISRGPSGFGDRSYRSFVEGGVKGDGGAIDAAKLLIGPKVRILDVRSVCIALAPSGCLLRIWVDWQEGDHIERRVRLGWNIGSMCEDDREC